MSAGQASEKVDKKEQLFRMISHHLTHARDLNPRTVMSALRGAQHVGIPRESKEISALLNLFLDSSLWKHSTQEDKQFISTELCSLHEQNFLSTEDFRPADLSHPFRPASPLFATALLLKGGRWYETGQ